MKWLKRTLMDALDNLAWLYALIVLSFMLRALNRALAKSAAEPESEGGVEWCDCRCVECGAPHWSEGAAKCVERGRSPAFPGCPRIAEMEERGRLLDERFQRLQLIREGGAAIVCAQSGWTQARAASNDDCSHTLTEHEWTLARIPDTMPGALRLDVDGDGGEPPSVAPPSDEPK